MFQPNRIVALTTDFGISGSYVGAMRGAVLSRCTVARLVDITHQIPPQDVSEAARVLEAAAPYFPQGTVHLVVVDPGVGTRRREVVVSAGGQVFVGPDNGVLCRVSSRLGLDGAWAIEHESLRSDQVSSTFHGRDIFGPTAGCIANGFRPADVGPPIVLVEPPESLTLPYRDGPVMVGAVESVDHFGNILTNISVEQLPYSRPLVQVAEFEIQRWVDSYGQAEPADVVALTSSEGMLEIAQSNGNAAATLGVNRGAVVRVRPRGVREP